MGEWGWLIIIYLFLGGLGAGAYIASFAADRGWLKSPSLARWGYIVSAPLIAVGTLLLVFDLGQGKHKPLLIIGMVKNFTSSVMTWGFLLLSVFIVLGLIRGFLALIKKPAPAALSWVAAIFALGVMAYTGTLLAVLQAMPFWNNIFLPILFTISAISTGMSLVVLISHFLEKGHADERHLSIVHIVAVILELIVIAVFLLTSTQDSASASAQALISGDYAIYFWGLLIALGLVIPLLVYIWYVLTSKAPATVGAKESAAAAEKSSAPVLLVDLFVLVGGFFLRYVVVLAALPIWDGIIK